MIALVRLATVSALPGPLTAAQLEELLAGVPDAAAELEKARDRIAMLEAKGACP